MEDKTDYRYDPKVMGERRTRRSRRSTFNSKVISAIVWTVVGLALYKAFSAYMAQHPGAPSVSVVDLAQIFNRCEPLPPNGAVNLLEPSIMRRSDAVYSALKVDSSLKAPSVLVISDPERTVPYQTVAVHPGQSAQVNLPLGKYGLVVLVGTTWCNTTDGFVDGNRVLSSSPIEIKNGETANLKMQESPTPGRLNLVISYVSLAQQMAETLPKQVQGNGYLDLRRDSGGNYRVSGVVNTTPVEFVVDTGATLTSINRLTAVAANILNCEPREFKTAAGPTAGCVGSAQQLKFGDFHVENVEVAIMPNLEAPLLGMNVLSQVHIEQHGDGMRISR